jgi:uncharacterized protein (TIGR02421 family)
MVWTSYKEKVKLLSERIVEAQKPIRILDAIKWAPETEEEFRKSKFREPPKVDANYYAQYDLGYDPKKKIDELLEIKSDIASQLGKDDSLGTLLASVTDEYTDVVRMVLARGTAEFWKYSRKLYGSPKDTLFGDVNRISDLGKLLYSIFGKIDHLPAAPSMMETLTSDEAVAVLNERFEHYFHDHAVRAKVSDGIVADSAAGSEVVKIREGSKFSRRDVDILEVHEGWVHVGTTQNGLRQNVAKWLAKGPPRCASTQEGLAVIMEIFSFRTYPGRARRINNRILAIDKAEDGASLLDLFEFYRTEGYDEEECFYQAKRVVRGGLIDGGAPFTKDIAYCKGFIENYNFMRSAIRLGRPELIPFLFAGKMNLEDVPLLYQKHLEGVVDAPHYLPPQFLDLNGIAVWMSFSSFLNMVDLKKVQEHYDRLFSQHL